MCRKISQNLPLNIVLDSKVIAHRKNLTLFTYAPVNSHELPFHLANKRS